jgi:hypothetical protein
MINSFDKFKILLEISEASILKSLDIKDIYIMTTIL